MGATVQLRSRVSSTNHLLVGILPIIGYIINNNFGEIDKFVKLRFFA